MPAAQNLPNHRLLYESENLHLYYNFADDWLYADFIGEHTIDSIKADDNQLLYWLKAERTHKLLNNNTRSLNIWSDAINWVAQEYIPKLAAAGLEYIAWVNSPDYYCRLSSDKLLEQQVSTVFIVAFDNTHEAEDWLRSV